jgi:hypothetical protein
VIARLGFRDEFSKPVKRPGEVDAYARGWHDVWGKNLLGYDTLPKKYHLRRAACSTCPIFNVICSFSVEQATTPEDVLLARVIDTGRVYQVCKGAAQSGYACRTADLATV